MTMRAITVTPKVADSLRLRDIARPAADSSLVVVQTHVIGVCGTDHEIVRGEYGTAPADSDFLVLGHESAGRVVSAPRGSGFAKGDWVVGIVRRPDPVPCPNCAAGEWDMCTNGLYVEHGIKGLHGFGAEFYAVSPTSLVRGAPALAELNVLVEPASVLAKAWQHIDYLGGRSRWHPRTVLVTGAGPIGLLAALLGVQRGYEVHVLDRPQDGPKPALVAGLGATYHTGELSKIGSDIDIVLECTGAPSLFVDVLTVVRPNGIVCLTGVSSGGSRVTIDAGLINRELVLENNIVFGSVNANRTHYEHAVAALELGDRGWLERLITRRVQLGDFESAFKRADGDVKTIVEFIPTA